MDPKARLHTLLDYIETMKDALAEAAAEGSRVDAEQERLAGGTSGDGRRELRKRAGALDVGDSAAVVELVRNLRRFAFRQELERVLGGEQAPSMTAHNLELGADPVVAVAAGSRRTRSLRTWSSSSWVNGRSPLIALSSDSSSEMLSAVLSVWTCATICQMRGPTDMPTAERTP